MTEAIILIFLAVCVILYFVHKKNTKRTPQIEKGNELDSQIQNAHTRTTTEKKSLTLQEKIDLSWKFLFDITEKVLNAFSNEDRTQVAQIGRDLLANGMRYEHVVDPNIGNIHSKSRVAELEQNKEKDDQVSRG